jgi:hypothetical protein
MRGAEVFPLSALRSASGLNLPFRLAVDPKGLERALTFKPAPTVLAPEMVKGGLSLLQCVVGFNDLTRTARVSRQETGGRRQEAVRK